MSFVSKCVNYSQCFVLKNKILQPLLKMYNDFLLKQKISNDNFCLNKDINTGVSSEFIIPNNNIKYYLFNFNRNICYWFKIVRTPCDCKEREFNCCWGYDIGYFWYIIFTQY